MSGLPLTLLAVKHHIKFYALSVMSLNPYPMKPCHHATTLPPSLLCILRSCHIMSCCSFDVVRKIAVFMFHSHRIASHHCRFIRYLLPSFRYRLNVRCRIFISCTSSSQIVHPVHFHRPSHRPFYTFHRHLFPLPTSPTISCPPLALTNAKRRPIYTRRVSPARFARFAAASASHPRCPTYAIPSPSSSLCLACSFNLRFSAFLRARCVSSSSLSS